MRNEIVSEMNINDYHKHDGLSNSGLKHLLDCPARYYTEYLDPNKPKVEKKPEYALGSAVHSLVLEPDRFWLDNYVMPKCDKRTTKGKEDFALHTQAAGTKNLINEEQYDQSLSMCQRLFKGISWLKSALKGAGIEQSFFWVDEDTGVQLKSRPDAYTEDFYIDLKTTSNLRDFARNVYNYGYHRQAAMAREALHKLIGIRYSHFIYIVVEESYPYLTQSFCLDESSLEKGHSEFKRGAEIYKQCKEKNEWPGYGTGITQLYLPKWLE